MTKREFAIFKKNFNNFLEREGIGNLSSGHLRCPDCNSEWDDNDKCGKCNQSREVFDEPFLSWRPCQCCGTPLGGDREVASGYNPATKEVQEYGCICQDCIYYAEYGRLDDMTMDEIERSEE